MSKPNTIKIDEIEYVRADQAPVKPSKKKIVILQRGWIVVGDFSQEGQHCTLEKSSVIRSWGTSKGLGQLALEGPQSSTKLDACGTCEFHEMNVVAMLNIKNPEKW